MKKQTQNTKFSAAKIADFVVFLFFELFIQLFRFIPFFILYLISDFLFILIFLIGYRKKVITKNLQTAFPEKNEKEIKVIRRKFYMHFCDIIVEEIKSHTMTIKQAEKRFKLLSGNLIEEFHKKGQSVICLTGHYANWEWSTIAFKFQIEQDCISFYKPIKNIFIDNAIRKQREKFGMKIFPITQTPFVFKKSHDKNKIIFMIADQSNPNCAKRIWVNFMNQQTDCLHGPEYYAKMFDLPVIYAEVNKIKRGQYTCRMTVLEENSASSADGVITKKYFNALEKTIRQTPQYWLWSHNRWKNKRIASEKDKPVY